jgi:hypothetical protein
MRTCSSRQKSGKLRTDRHTSAGACAGIRV